MFFKGQNVLPMTIEIDVIDFQLFQVKLETANPFHSHLLSLNKD